MGTTNLRYPPQSETGAPSAAMSLDSLLVQQGLVRARDLVLAQAMQKECDASLDEVLLAEGMIDPQDLVQLRAQTLRCRSLGRADLAELRPIPVGVPASMLLKHAVLPVRDRDDEPALVCADPSVLEVARTHLPASLQSARLLLATRACVTGRIAEVYRNTLRDAASCRVPNHESCRSWGKAPRRRLALVLAGLALFSVVCMFYPLGVLSVVMGWAAFTLLVSAVFKLMAFTARATTSLVANEIDPERHIKYLTKVSVIVPLFRETEVAQVLVERLRCITYPKCLLDVILVLEEEDGLTSKALSQMNLPPWIRVVVVPDGMPRTKPRAMNYALDFCEGDIVGVLDAEDAPDPDQITRVAERFRRAPRDVVCLQGVLDYYNPRQNWLARCFTIEYAAWFRMILPGMARLGLAIPLGGTTLYFRRDALEELGGWDAHNVTEDADLGFRLARHGYSTEILATVTDEEANCHPWAWIKQRSRWLKGYMTTYLVHMRRPGLLYRQLGARKFWGFQAHFITALSQPMLAPFLWSFWLVFLGLPHPLDPVMPREAMLAVGLLFLTIEAVNIAIGFAAVSKPKHRHLLPWVPSLHFYWPLGAIAAYKALYELVVKPFFWDKTAHGLSLNHMAHEASDNAVDLS